MGAADTSWATGAADTSWTASAADTSWAASAGSADWGEGWKDDSWKTSGENTVSTGAHATTRLVAEAKDPSAAVAAQDSKASGEHEEFNEEIVQKCLEFLRQKEDKGKLVLRDPKARGAVSQVDAEEAIRRYDLEVLRNHQ